MNEKIKELMKQCYIPVVDREGDGEYDMEKFAELIVKECVSQCEVIGAVAAQTSTGEMARKTKATADSCAQFIKDHFGVK
jgi:hypothetical protein